MEVLSDVQSTQFAIAFLGGLVPAIFWLWFWLREDRLHPEPIGLIIISFIAGMLVVPLVLPLQYYAKEMFTGEALIFAWVVIEEVLKYAVALAVILWNEKVDEPIDLIIYMIVIALGFAALENTLFIFNPLIAGDIFSSFITGNFRFLGSTLLHVLASGTLGVLMAFAFYRSKMMKLLFSMVGLFMAIVLHALFNFFIMNASGETSSQTVFTVFLFVWMGIVLLFIVFEKIKLQENRQTLKN